MTDLLGEMYGERAVQAEFATIVCRRSPVEGVARAMIGGVVLAGIGDEGWQRWRGTMILIPSSIDKPREKNASAYPINRMMVDFLNHDLECETYWKAEWRCA